MKFRLVEDAEVLKDPEVEETIEELPEEEQDVVEEILSVIDDVTPIDNPNDITRALDAALQTALDAFDVGAQTAGAAANVLLVGGAGVGKSKIVRQWAKHRKINLVSKNASSFDKADMGGGVAAEVDDTGKRLNSMTRLTNKEFDSLMKPGSVLFLDELNRADPEVVGSLLTLILDHTVPDNYSEGAVKYLPGYLFTIAAINPAKSDAYSGTSEFDNALLDRFSQIAIYPDIPQYRKHLLDELNHNLEVFKKKAEKNPARYAKKITETEGRIKLATTVLSSPLFSFDSIEDEEKAYSTEQEGDRKILQNKILSPRGFSALIRACNGTKEDFLKRYPDFCNINKLDIMEQILTSYKDVEDKANSALKYKDGFLPDEEEETIFKENDWDKLSGLL